MVEGIIDDLKHGHIPNIFKERGWKAELKHNPKAVAKKVAVSVFVTAAVAVFIYTRSSKSQK